MKITWFGGATFRIQIGGKILVVDPDGASDDIARNELVSGADHVVRLNEPCARVDVATWKRRPAERLLDAGEILRPLQLWSVKQGGLLVDGDDDMPLLLLQGMETGLGRWVEKSVVILVGTGLEERVATLLDGAAPRLIAMAGSEADTSAAFDRVRNLLDGTGLVALERGLAIEA